MKKILLLFFYLVHGSRSQLCGGKREYKVCGNRCQTRCPPTDTSACALQCRAGCFCRDGFCLNEESKCVESSFYECEINEEFDECGTACPKRCGEPPAEFCTEQCVQGCFCKEGYCLDGSDKCVPDCGMNEVFSSCGTFCPEICGQPEPDVCATGCVEGCFCEEGYCLDQTTGNCMEKEDIMTCGPNEEYSSCGSACPQKCGEEPELCIQSCQEGCFCKEGYCLDDLSNCVPSCGMNEVFDSCGTACPEICGQPAPDLCATVCVEGCFCEEGYCLDQTTGSCMEKGDIMTCGPNEEYSTCGSACPQKCGEEPELCIQSCQEGCFCKEGYCLDEGGKCVPSCGTNEVFNSCGSSCPQECGKPPPKFCDKRCNEGCFCEEGYCLDAKSNCVEV